MRLDINTTQEYWGLLFHMLDSNSAPVVDCNGFIHGALLEAVPGQSNSAVFQTTSGDFKVMVDNSTLSTVTPTPLKRRDDNNTTTTPGANSTATPSPINIILGDSTSGANSTTSGGSSSSTLTQLAIIPTLSDLTSMFALASNVSLTQPPPQQDDLDFVNLAVQALTGGAAGNSTSNSTSTGTGNATSSGGIDPTSPGIVAFQQLFTTDAPTIRQQTACNFQDGGCSQAGNATTSGGGQNVTEGTQERPIAGRMLWRI